MKIKKFSDEKLGETVFCARHSSGLEIRILPKRDYGSAYAVFGVKYGSIDSTLINEKGEKELIPDGTAHFLEHKLFESEDLGAFERFSKTGASANAYTSWEKTAYLFQASDNFRDSLEILLDFVQNPYFTPQTVEKEQGIIGQEIKMYKDSPDWELTFNLLGALYRDNPVKIDAAGTVESIARIDADLLYRVYDAFYVPANMVLCVAGAAEPEEVFSIVEKRVGPTAKAVPEREFKKEDPSPVKKYAEEKMSIAQKQFMLGYKTDISEPVIGVENETAFQIALDAAAGKSSPLFKRLFDEGLIDANFGAELVNGFGYCCVMMGGTSREPEKTADLARREMERIRKEGLDPAAFERAKRKRYGRLIMRYNDISDTADLLMDLYFNGYEPFRELEACKAATLEKTEEKFSALRPEASALSVVAPLD